MSCDFIAPLQTNNMGMETDIFFFIGGSSPLEKLKLFHLIICLKLDQRRKSHSFPLLYVGKALASDGFSA